MFFAFVEMAPRRSPIPRRVNSNEEGGQVPQIPQESGPLPNLNANNEFRTALTMLANVVTTQVEQNVPTPASRVRDFTRMNPPEFHGSKLDEDPQDFIDEIYKILDIMGVTSNEKAELAAFQLKGIAQVWYDQWKETKMAEDGPITWEDFKMAFLDHYFPLELREVKMREFLNLKQDGMSVREYALRFSKLSKYAPTMMNDSRTTMGQFVSGLDDLVVQECQTALLIKEMDLARLMTYAEQMEGMKLREEKMREAKKA